MNKQLFIEAISKFLLGFFIVNILLFIPAGTIKWLNAWIFNILLFLPMFIVGIILFFKAPSLLKSRLNAKEKDVKQDKIIKYSGLIFIISFILAGLNYRYQLSKMPKIIIIIGIIIFIFSYILFAIVLKENAYLARTITIVDKQELVDKGLYAIIRHPMYLASILLFLSMPLILNSIYSFLVMLLYIPLIIKRLNEEEKFLIQELKGYDAYQNKVKYKLIPFIY